MTRRSRMKASTADGGTVLPGDVDLSNWPTVDEQALSASRRELYLRRVRAIRLYLDGACSAQIKTACGIGRSQAYRLLTERCLKQHRIHRYMVGLRMPRALEALDATLARFEQGDSSMLEVLETLLAEEFTTRETRRIKMALQTARLGTIKTLAGRDLPAHQRLLRAMRDHPDIKSELR